MPPGPARAESISFHGWRHACRLTNGLVSVTSVPQVGGRQLEYRLGSSNFLFHGRGELGCTLDDHRDRPYRYFGGHFAQLHPEAHWRTVMSSAPPALFMGSYEARVLPAQAGVAAVEMASPVDLATGTRIIRKVELFPNSSRVRLTDTLQNVRLVPQEWGLHDFVQLKGSATPSGVMRGNERPDGSIGLYVPLNPASRFPHGRRHLVSDGTVGPSSSQWTTSELPGILVLRYRRAFDKVLVDPSLPWIAFVDSATGHVFVQKCDVPEKTIFTAGRPVLDYPFIELQSFGPVARLGPGETATLTQEWYAASCGGPVVDVTAAGVVASPLSLLRGGGTTWAAGKFGVFYVGRAELVFRGPDDAELARLDVGAVGPLEPLVLRRIVDLPPKTAQIVLEITAITGEPVGDLGRILLSSGVPPSGGPGQQ